MKIFSEIPNKPGAFSNPVLTIGTFDGVHAGHQKILQTLFIVAKERNADPVVLTFETHPRKVLFPATPPRILTSKSEKIKAILENGIENIIMLQFSKAMANMHADEFLHKMIIDKIGIAHLVVGYDHAFGKDRDGNFNFLNEMSKKYGFGITRVEPRNYHSAPISSTWIRTEIEDGNISFANILLSRRYSLFGRVVKGDGRGTKLGFPTANIIPEDADKVIPKDGVYAVKVVINNSIKKDGMLNIGTNPTFSNTERTIEVNIFNFDRDIYGETLEIDFYDRLRDEIKFDSPGFLKEQLIKDKKKAQELLI
ncbi:MAG: bifunctional riboflavin kinase/FAD synthetase [Spirochaetes bacterium]|nr:bifunctional riboflavin kinase/FAD synthetase [Spirochaetota bacterium]